MHPGGGGAPGTLAGRDPTGARPLIDDVRANRRRARALLLAASLPVLVILAVLGALAAGPVLGILAAIVLAGLWASYVWRAGRGAARAALGGLPADPLQQARLHNLVEGLCTTAGLPKPEIVVVDDDAPNAAVFGHDPRDATLVVTTGLLERLGRVELEGVLARELAAVKSLDVLPATVAVGLLRVVGGVPGLGDRIRAAAATPAVAVDASGVAITRYPPGLTSAYEKLLPDGAAVATGSAATAHLWAVPPGSVAPPETCPPLEERIAALREL